MNTNDPAEMKEGNDGFLLLHRYRGAVMGFAALWILVFHEWLPVFGNYPKLAWIENFIQRIGFCGVDIFLFLSGIGMVYSIEKSERISVFYYKRIKRIVFPFLLVALIRWRFDGWTAAEFLKNILGVNFFRVDIYTYLWFVPMIMIFYLLFPPYYRFFKKASNQFIFTGCVLTIWLIWSLKVRMTLRIDMFGMTNRIPIFVIGILAGWAARNKKVIFDKLTWGFLVLVLVLGLYLSYLTGYLGLYILVPVSDCCVPNILLACSLSFLIPGVLYQLCEKSPFKIAGWVISYILSFYGMFTLEFYCIQEWLGGRIIQRMRDGHRRIVVNAAVFVLITVTAFVIRWLSGHFWMLMERIVGKVRDLPVPAGAEDAGEE